MDKNKYLRIDGNIFVSPIWIEKRKYKFATHAWDKKNVSF